MDSIGFEITIICYSVLNSAAVRTLHTLIHTHANIYMDTFAWTRIMSHNNCAEKANTIEVTRDDAK